MFQRLWWTRDQISLYTGNEEEGPVDITTPMELSWIPPSCPGAGANPIMEITWTK